MCRINRSVYIEHVSTTTSFTTSSSWTILSPIEQAILTKIKQKGIPLKNWGIHINRGILTGYNEAFIVSAEKKEELIAADPKSAEIIRPILRGKDIKRYHYSFAGLWLINTHNGIKRENIQPVNVNEYPAIKEYLEQFFPKLSMRADKGNTPYNLRNCVYLNDFFEQKIVWGNLCLR